MNTRVEIKSYSILRNDHCINRWVKYFYECELYKRMLPSHRLDSRTDRYVLDDPSDQSLFEEKRKILYAKYIKGLMTKYGNRKSIKMKKKILKLNMKMLKAMYLLTQNTKIYRYTNKFGNHSGYTKEIFDADT